MANTFLTVFKNKNFLKLWLGLITSQLAYNIVNFIVVLHIYELTGSSTSISLVLISSAIPSVIFGSFSGVIADRADYKKVMIYTSFLRFLAVIILIFSKNNLLALLEVIFLISTISQFFSPAANSSIPLIIKEKKLVAANSVMVTTSYATILIGYSMAGILMGVLTTKGALLFSALLYLLATYSIFCMKKYDHKPVLKTTLSKVSHSIEHIWTQTRDSFIHLGKNCEVYSPIIKLTLGWAILGAFIVLAPGFAEKEIGLNAKQVGPYIVAPAGVGMILGAYYLNKKRDLDFRKYSNLGIAFTGLSLLLFSIYRTYQGNLFSLPLAIILMIMMGVSSSIVYISSQTLLHMKVEGHIRGRIFGITSMLTNIAMSIPAIFAGGISDLTSPFVSMLFVSLMVGIYGVITYFREDFVNQRGRKIAV